MPPPRIAITVGDPAGIGPEIAAKAAADASVLAVCEPVMFAPPANPAIRMGEVSAAAGQAAYDTILRAVDAAKRGEVDAIATAPISKLAFTQAGLPWKGHTELLGHLCGAERVAMMFYAPQLRVVLLTVHVPLAEVPGLITRESGRGHAAADRGIPAAVRHRAAAPRAGRPQPARGRRRRARVRGRGGARAGRGRDARAGA